MTSATAVRLPEPDVHAPTALDRDLAADAWRVARFAEISAETAEWIAADLKVREAQGGGSFGTAADRIWRRAVAYRDNARRHRVAAGLLARPLPEPSA